VNPRRRVKNFALEYFLFYIFRCIILENCPNRDGDFMEHCLLGLVVVFAGVFLSANLAGAAMSAEDFFKLCETGTP
jgi:hypothetical protein